MCASRCRRLNEESGVALALAELQQYLDGSWLVFYTAGSSEYMNLVGWVGGFGVYYPQLGCYGWGGGGGSTAIISTQGCPFGTRYAVVPH